VGTPASGGGGAAAARPRENLTAVRGWPGLNHGLPRKLPCNPRKVPGKPRSLDKWRRSELDGGGPAAAAEARAPAKGWLSVINTWLGEVL
jgi:hypothetical protein